VTERRSDEPSTAGQREPLAFQDGVHSDTRDDPGAGGVEMMRVRSSGLTVNVRRLVRYLGG
jgi:hypothetical protein